MEIIIKDKVFKQTKINKSYYISKDGEVYSNHSKKIIKPLKRGKSNKKYEYVDITVNGKQKHIYVHRLVYDTWVEDIINTDKQINHINDNEIDNIIENLYSGTQKDNILDCINNEHRVGNIYYLTVYDKEKNKTLTFSPSRDFADYCGHPCKNGSINRFFKRNWFKKRYEIIEYRRIKTLSELEGVTTITDECKLVG